MLINTPCTLCLLMMWPALHDLVAFTVIVSEVAVVHGSHSKWQAHSQNDGLMFETTGSHAKWQAHLQNDGFACEMTGSRSKRWACMWNDGLTFKMTGSCAKWQAHVRNSGLVFEMTVSCLRQWGHIQNDGLTPKTVGLCLKWQALVSVGGVHRRHVGPNVMLSSGGGHEGKWGNWETSCLRFASSRTWWVSNSMGLLSHLSTPSQTRHRTLQWCEETAYIPCWRGEAGWRLLARNMSAWGRKI